MNVWAGCNSIEQNIENDIQQKCKFLSFTFKILKYRLEESQIKKRFCGFPFFLLAKFILLKVFQFKAICVRSTLPREVMESWTPSWLHRTWS